MKKKPSQDIPKVKIYGQPLARLFSQIQRIPHAPQSVEILRDLSHALEKHGLSYHSRTLKRQLQGRIAYVPLALETEFLHWIKSRLPHESNALIKNFDDEKQQLQHSDDPQLYVNPEVFRQLTQAYLWVRKGLSKRKLALLLEKSLQQKNIALGLETLQATLGGKTQKVRKILEDELRSLLKAEGYQNEKQLQELFEKSRSDESLVSVVVESEAFLQVLEAYRLRSPHHSKRQLALELQKRLKNKGYSYHLSSLQSILEGKTHRTRKVLLETLKEILESTGWNSTKSVEVFLDSLPSAVSAEHQYRPIQDLTEKIDGILQKNPGLTRRQLAILLRQDLLEKNFEFSLNTLQYILGGKTRKVRGIVLDLLDEYQKQDQLSSLVHTTSKTPHDQSLAERLCQDYQVYLEAPQEKKADCRDHLFKVRQKLIMQRWKVRHPKTPVNNRKPHLRKTDAVFWKEEAHSHRDEHDNEPNVAYAVGENFGRHF